ncbi:hypothetical protein PT974_10723 [Cladobotryum mycophilum]|uniref:Uncharacterized protein n=1 Tax=Cladobotryum mycophilum TaxID=491253 RepID=A0ABR0SBK9_9HYPO
MNITTKYFSRRDQQPPLVDQRRAFNIAMGAILMRHVPLQFTTSVFPLRRFSHVSDIDKATAGFTELTATNLKRIAGLQFQGTSDLSEHLKLDQATVTAPSTTTPASSAFESIRLLFPRDSDSHSLLRSLVSKRGFDPDCLYLGAAPLRRDDDKHEADVKFLYLAPRLMDLFEEIENPKPRGLLDKWLEQRSKARHVMLATLAGVVIAILLGILGLIVGIFQACVSYQAWKHPVGN